MIFSGCKALLSLLCTRCSLSIWRITYENNYDGAYKAKTAACEWTQGGGWDGRNRSPVSVTFIPCLYHRSRRINLFIFSLSLSLCLAVVDFSLAAAAAAAAAEHAEINVQGAIRYSEGSCRKRFLIGFLINGHMRPGERLI